MQFTVVVPKGQKPPTDNSRVPDFQPNSVKATRLGAKTTRYITMYEKPSTKGGKNPFLYINGRKFQDPATEKPKAGKSEVWEVINLTKENRPLHIHLATFQAIKVVKLVSNVTDFKACMLKGKDGNATACKVNKFVSREEVAIPNYQKAWKNTVNIEAGCQTTVVVKFPDGNKPSLKNIKAEPGYVYHFNVLDGENNAMMRPLKLV
ncbi:PREDICTED: multicopper oxidase LPR1-like [Nelumbo nucifera]|uniref:Plastocyanin-like domain-containing protein n=2 Tax=Nelumbo nucifera TaxID=4432 RepID=A0A822YZ31_NELNU|nr:PREDICTED: multicopper oxidase LPR1-like [Nelumbo nucifera]DAD36509.1 TPA_asm: hypothetical protein HUJ06_007150 [Nelumbo nucifera]